MWGKNSKNADQHKQIHEAVIPLHCSIKDIRKGLQK